MIGNEVFWRTDEGCFHATATLGVRFDANRRPGEIETADAFEMKWASEWFCEDQPLASHEIKHLRENSKSYVYDV